MKYKPAVLIISIVLMLSVASTGCKNNGEEDENMDNQTGKNGFNAQEQIIVIEMEEGGIIKIELYPEQAPITVENFAGLVEDGFYDGTIFHRVMEGFMIQGGDPTGTGTGGSGTNIKGEFKQNNVDNNLSHVRGVISMARSNDPNSASSQFFIMHKDSLHLDGGYAAFGKVIEGIEVVDKIASVETDDSDPNFPRPLVPQTIKEMRVEDRD